MVYQLLALSASPCSSPSELEMLRCKFRVLALQGLLLLALCSFAPPIFWEDAGHTRIQFKLVKQG